MRRHFDVTRALGIPLLLAVCAPIAASQLRAAPAGAQGDPQQEPPPRCCFTNPRYAGTCEVDPARDETCAEILAYLNNPMSQGKSYCGNTELRGGWQSVACVPK